MKATEAKLLNFLKKSPQFVIPIYQRTYSWTEKECRQLWDDVLRCGLNDRIGVHFIGSIVYIESGLSQVTDQAPLLVIDGQQRLTTVTILLAALAAAVADSEPFDGFSQRKIRNYYLLNPEEDGDRRFKLLLSQTDKASLTALVDGSPFPKDHSVRVIENHALFGRLIDEAKSDLPALCRGLSKLVIVDVALTRDQDNPQLIFESMNSTGKELSQADLIRNFILMGLEPKLQTRLYDQFWRPMETDFGQEGYGTHFDGFTRHYLTVKTGAIPNINAVYEAFKDHARNSRAEGQSEAEHVEALVADIHRYAEHYCAMALGKESDPELRRAFHDLRELKVDVAYPFLLELYQDYVSGLLMKSDFAAAVRLIEAYVFRRAVCAIPTNSMNKTFATFAKALKKDRYLESIKAHFLSLPSYRRFPNDDEFRRDIQTRDLYNFRSRSYWLRRFENFERKEPITVDNFTIEHILPQNEQLNNGWRMALGEDWQRVQQTWLHTLGNLTLTGYNAEYSDRVFSEKRDMKGGFGESPLILNKGLGQVTNWDEAAIKTRATQLAERAARVWESPRLSAETLAIYQNPVLGATGYTISDHPNLSLPGNRELFDALRNGVMALDPCVSEEFQKHYVAFKAETNFADVVPQVKRLVILLNMRFLEINDPLGICQDMTGVGRWGNGDVSVNVSGLDELPYVMGLIRQALELQLDGPNA